jgi:signal transduction histidine kinase
MMMIIVLSSLALVFALIIIAQWVAHRSMRRQIQYMTDKLSEIVMDESSERLLIMTDNKELRALLVSINLLLEQRKGSSVQYASKEISLRRMISNISHDIRTPLTIVSGYIETLLLRTDITPDERVILLEKVFKKSQEVIGMINAFFDLTKLESGDRVVPLSRIQMNEVCRQSILSYYDVLSASGLEVVIEIPDEPIYAYANEAALERILNNLISNAIHYGGEGQMLGLTLHADSSFVYVDVKDNGKGIQEIDQDHIFERLYTLEDSRNRNYQGSGLGLTITKRLVELLQGHISVKSKPYEGTIFTVQLRKMTF